MTLSEVDKIMHLLTSGDKEIVRLGMFLLHGHYKDVVMIALPEDWRLGRKDFLDSPVYRIIYNKHCAVRTNRYLYFGPKRLVARRFHNFGRIDTKLVSQ